MKIDKILSYAMFEVAKIDREKFYQSLRTMGPKQLKSEFRSRWSEDNPTWCYCYVASEFLWYYVAPEGSKPYKLKVPNDPGTHRFIKWPHNIPIDLTAEQFDNYEDVDYNKGQVCYFMQTGCKGPSKRAKMLAELMGYHDIIRR